LHIGSKLPPKDNLRTEDKSSAPKVSFIRRFHCTTPVWSYNITCWQASTNNSPGIEGELHAKISRVPVRSLLCDQKTDTCTS